MRIGVLLYRQLVRPKWTSYAPNGILPPALIFGSCGIFNPSVVALLPVHLGILVTRKFTRILKFNSLPTTSEL